MLSEIMIRILEYAWVVIAAVVYTAAWIRVFKDIKVSMDYCRKGWIYFLDGSTKWFLAFNIIAIFIISLSFYMGNH